MTMNEKRMKKYPDTKWFHYYNANPKGKITGDCVIRALSAVTGMSYADVSKELFDRSMKTGYTMISRETYSKFLEDHGFVKIKQPKKEDNTWYKAKELIENLPKLFPHYLRYDNSKIFCHLGSHHVGAIVDGKVNDIWDSSREKVGIVYIKVKSI